MHAVLESVARRISREVDGLDVSAARKRPNGNGHKWNSQEVVEHLVLTYRVTAQALQARLDKGRVIRRQKRSLVQWTLQLMILSFGYLPQGMPALEETVPTSGSFHEMDGEDLAALLEKELESMDAVLDRCRHKFGMERVAAHPILGPLRVDQWRRFHAVHGAHHLKQLRLLQLQTGRSVVRGRMGKLTLTKELQIPAQRSLT